MKPRARSLVLAMSVSLLGGFTNVAAQVVVPQVVTGFEGSVAFGPQVGSGLIKGLDGALYGITYDSSNTRCGTVYKILADGTLIVLHEFGGALAVPSDGCRPQGELVQGADGNLYGTTTGGGNTDSVFTGGAGTIFKISPDGDGALYAVLHRFAASPGSYPEGAAPLAGLTIGLDGNFYGTTSYGGTASGTCIALAGVAGTFYQLTPAGAFSVKHHFDPETDGCGPVGNLTLAADGTFMGATLFGGYTPIAAFAGTIFNVTPSGAFTALFMFPGNPTDGYEFGQLPYSSPIQASDGGLYGTTTAGGPKTGDGSEAGTVYKLSFVDTGWQPTRLHAFNTANGGGPFGGLARGTDSNYYGTTTAGGAQSNGVLFKITPAGVFTLLFSFDGTSPSFNGVSSYARLLETSPGVFHGTTFGGGSAGQGTVFKFMSTALKSLTFKQVVPGCGPINGRVALTAPAPPGGLTVELASDNDAASVPAALFIPERRMAAAFAITPMAVTASATGDITASLGAQALNRALTVRPIGVRALTLDPNPVQGGNEVTGTIALECAAAPADITATVLSTKPAVAQPLASVPFPAGSDVQTFQISTRPVATTTAAAIKASANAITKSEKLTVIP